MPKRKISKRAQNTPSSPIRRLAHLANKAEKSGTHVYCLNIGQPDIESPQEFFEGLRLFNRKIIAYDESQGSEVLCAAWSDYLNRQLHLKTAPEQFLITMGASEALIFLFATCCDSGDEIIVFDPTYANYLGFAAIAGVNLIPVPSHMDHDFSLPTRTEIERRITGRTRAILVCSPNNPTGTVCNKEEMMALLQVCDEHGMFLIVDETYREFVFDGLEPFSVLQLAPDNPCVVVVDSLSKRFSLCGTRIGCLLTCNKDVLAATLAMAQARLSAPRIEQFAAAYMLERIGDDYLKAVTREYQLRRDALHEALQRIPGVAAHKPEGAFYTITRLPVDNAESFASFLLFPFSYKKRTTFVAPAAGFYVEKSRGIDEVRIGCVLQESDLEDAVEALAAGIEEYQRRPWPPAKESRRR